MSGLTELRVPGVLLAGGLSRRMGGGDKSLKALGALTMLEHVIARLRPQVGALVINANGDPQRFAAFGLPVVADPIAGFVGPLAGVLAGLRWAEQNMPQVSHAVTAATDAPFMPADLVARLEAAVDGRNDAIALAASDGRSHPVFGLWPVALADDLQTALEQGVRKVLAWTDRHETRLVEFDMCTIGGRLVDPFFNANRPEELAEAHALLDAMRTQAAAD